MTKSQIELKSKAIKTRVESRRKAEEVKEELRLRKMIDDDAYFEQVFKECGK